MAAALQSDGGRPPLSFGPFTIDTNRAELTRNGETVALRPKVFALLLHLVDRAGSLVGKQELLDTMWPGVIVTDDSLSQVISELRNALGDHDQKLIRTVPRRGYRLDAAVHAVPRGVPVQLPLPQPEVHATFEPRARPGRPRPAIVFTTLVLICLVAFALVQHRRVSSTRIGTALAESRSLAVMPFTDLSDPPAPHLAHAVDTELIADLGRLADTRVMARASAAVLGTSANADVKRVGRELGVRHVVTGSVRRNGEQVQITVQLARADTAALLWTERFDYASTADLMSQRHVSARIANWLDVQVRDAALQQARFVAHDNEAVDRWMRGTYILSHAQTRADLLRARAEFQAALTGQPDSTHALAGLATTHIDEVFHRWADDRAASLETAERLARLAVELDPNHLEALAALGRSLMFNGKLDEAMRITQKRLDIIPTDPYATLHLAAVLYFRGLWEEAVQKAEASLRLNPLDRNNAANCNRLIATSLLVLGRYD